jgi:hypothetical protein
MKKAIRIQFAGFVGTGRTKKLAKEELARQLTEALTGSYAPILIQWRETTFLAARDLQEGWRQYEFAEGRLRPICTFSNKDRAYIEDCLRHHAAQIEWNGEIEEPAVLAKASQNVREQFASWAQWQRRYRQFRQALEAKGYERDEADKAARSILDGIRRPEEYGLRTVEAETAERVTATART